MFQAQVKKIKTHILRSITFFPENYSVHERIWENMVEPDRQPIIQGAAEKPDFSK